ncbi:MAG: hypothetical protein WDN28_03150 [Chthoniobacter sp.]
MISNTSRRDFLRRGFKLGAAATLVGITGCTKSGSPQSAVEQLKFYGTGTLHIENWDQAKKDLGISIVFTDNGNDVGPVITEMVTGSAALDYDIGGLQGGAEFGTCTGGSNSALGFVQNTQLRCIVAVGH